MSHARRNAEQLRMLLGDVDEDRERRVKRRIARLEREADDE